MKKAIWATAAQAFILLVFPSRSSAASPSAWLTLPDGSSNRIVAVTFGTNHFLGSPVSRMVSHLPDALQDMLPSSYHETTTQKPTLVVWLERHSSSNTPPMYGNPYALLADGNGFISGPQNFPTGGFGTLDIVPTAFDAYPRRDAQIVLKFFNRTAAGQATNCGTLQFPNPFARAYPDWKPEPLPATKHVGDLDVTLLRFETGHGANMSYGPSKGGMKTVYATNRPDGWNQTLVQIEARNPTGGGHPWKVVSVESSDATGNDIHSTGINSSSIGNESNPPILFMPGLWPSEKAWKVKFEIAQAAGFAADSLVTFANVPLGEVDSTTSIGQTTNIAGFTLSLARIDRRQPNTNLYDNRFPSSNVRFTNSAIPSGIQVDLLRVVYDQETTNQSESWSTSDYERNYSFRQIPLDAKTASFIFAVHKSRFVEFIVRPELPAAP